MRCSALFTARAYFLGKIKKHVVSKCGHGYGCWEYIASDEDRLLVLYLDCTSLRKEILFRLSSEDIGELESLTRLYCYRLHHVRSKIHEMLMDDHSSKGSTKSYSTLLQPYCFLDRRESRNFLMNHFFPLSRMRE